MADVTLWGATYSGVPSVLLPANGGGTAQFDDTTGTTATAADIANGKTAWANGSLLTGTASGGSAQEYIMRPDAELVHTYSADELLVEDRGVALPAYATSAKVLVTGANLTPTVTVDYSKYDYFITMRGLAIPQYNTTTKQKGRCDYGASSYLYELAVVPANEIKTIDGSKTYTSRNAVIAGHGNAGREVYWTSATAIGVANNVTYGAYCTGQTPTISGTTLTVKAPVYGIRGNTSQMTSGAWGTMTDIRFQWVIQVWRAPIAELAGWEHTNAIRSIFEDVRNGGDLK